MYFPRSFPPDDISWSGLIPQRGHDLKSEIECYSLPFGGLGFVSHFLTYYTLFCLWIGKRPLQPSQKLSFSVFDILLGFGTLTLSTGISIFVIIRCRNTWQLLVIAVWKMSLSILNGTTAIHAAWVVGKNGGGSTKGTWKSMLWLLLYVLGMFAGMTGLMDLVVQNLPEDKGLLKLTAAFFGLVGAGVLILIFGLFKAYCCGPATDDDEVDLPVWILGGFTWSLTLFTILAAFFSDWALGMMTNNLVGFPTPDNARFYWSYFAATRLTLISF